MILPGVTIGHGAIVGAGAVVGRDVPDYTVVAGNPAQVVKARFPPAVVDQLLRLRWWDLPLEHLREILPVLASADVAALAGMLMRFRPD